MLPLDSKNRARVRLYIKVKKNHIPKRKSLFVLSNIMQVKLRNGNRMNQIMKKKIETEKLSNVYVCILTANPPLGPTNVFNSFSCDILWQSLELTHNLLVYI